MASESPEGADIHQLNEAYRVLSDAELRAEYTKSLTRGERLGPS